MQCAASESQTYSFEQRYGGLRFVFFSRVLRWSSLSGCRSLHPFTPLGDSKIFVSNYIRRLSRAGYRSMSGLPVSALVLSVSLSRLIPSSRTPLPSGLRDRHIAFALSTSCQPLSVKTVESQRKRKRVIYSSCLRCSLIWSSFRARIEMLLDNEGFFRSPLYGKSMNSESALRKNAVNDRSFGI